MFEVLLSFLKPLAENPVAVAFELTVVRVVLGYLENRVKNSREAFEWSKFFETMFRMLPQTIGLAAFGIPSAGALVTDIGITKFAKTKKK